MFGRRHYFNLHFNSSAEQMTPFALSHPHSNRRQMKFALQTWLLRGLFCRSILSALVDHGSDCLVAGYIFHNGGMASFAAGFLGAGLLWLLAAYYMDYTTQSILTDKVNRLFPLNVLVMTSVVGGLVGGFAALTGR